MQARPAVPPQAARREDPAPPSQLTPGVSAAEPGTSWSQVVGRKQKRKEAQAAASPSKSTEKRPAVSGAAKPEQRATRPKVGKPFRSAAITITANAQGADVPAAVAQMRRKIKLSDFGIFKVRPKRAVTGALIIEIPGEGNKTRADRLHEAMSALARELGVKITRPVKTCELRVKGLDDSITPEEIEEAVMTVGSCRPTDVKVGRARASPNGLSTSWIRCPIAVGRKVMDTRSLSVGWVRAPVEVLERQHLQATAASGAGTSSPRARTPRRKT
ncbi:uncharacterized protein LOC109860885 [Pseudomyrmex gracilis]|uniref:uncharacterized protein LOC109860885 n=1 Tax=Pseudomyrmex gracilis TaxID=219809 RepID=UPI000994AA2D|nr:uncharacterized protein LOC109860885 [Pseudomyrmex gracilis]